MESLEPVGPVDGAIILPFPRPQNIEQEIINQVVRIGSYRTASKPWREGVFHLRDLVVGIEDKEFFDGIPDKARKKKLSKRELQIYHSRGWDTFIVRSWIEEIDGEIIENLDPTPDELSSLLKILMALLARNQITWRGQTEDVINSNPVPDPDDSS